MGRPELGTKCTCASCAARFYDLNRSPAVCPKCGAPQPPVVVRAARPARTNFASAHMSRRPMPAIAEEEAEPLAAVEDDVDEDGDDDTDVPEIEADGDTEVDPAIVRD
ncbi:MAG TPA: TIGR02300 family protein [Acetobacteraceae bacterium]|nr:TIGR02300 family protein [Acetobacteraceae bacterium]